MAPPEKPGGIGSIVAYIKSIYKDNKRIIFISPYQKPIFIPKIFFLIPFSRNILPLFKLIISVLKSNYCTNYYIFSSAGYSFLERIVWSLIIKQLGHNVNLIFVDGNFPKVWRNQSILFNKLQLSLLDYIKPNILCQSNEWKDYYISILGKDFSYGIFPSTSRIESELKSSLLKKNEKCNLSVLYVGWIKDDKGLKDFCSCARFNKSHNFKLIGPYYGNLPFNDFIYTLPENIEYIPPLENLSDLIESFLMADIFLFASKAEGHSVALLEAMSAGLPIIAYDIIGNQNLVEDSKNGFLAKAFDVSDLNRKLSILLSSKSLLQSMSLASINKYKTEYSNVLYKKHLNKLFDLENL
tara:strand:- start:17093 stop:18154 length:1062 start_codon:yes stop_codon:yes gene_type:complete